MPTRRILELIVLGAILTRPVFGLAHMWAVKALGTQPEGSIGHGVASVVVVLV